MKKHKKIIAIVLALLIVGISIFIVVNEVPSLKAKNQMKEALNSHSFEKVQSVYKEYFYLDEPQNVQVETYGDTTITTSGALVSKEMNAVSEVLVLFFEMYHDEIYNTFYNEEYTYYCDDMSQLSEMLRESYGDIVVDENDNYNVIWETEEGTYYVSYEVKEAYNRLMEICASVESGIEYIDDSYDDVQEDDSSNNIQNILSMYNTDCRPFSDGYSLCRPYDIEPRPLYVIDKQGGIVGETYDESVSGTSLSSFNNGVALFMDIDSYNMTQEAKLVNTNLNVLLSAPNEKFDNMIGITEDNVILVMKMKKTIDGTSVQLGAVDKSGNFVTPLTDSKISINTEQTIITASYWGEGIFCVDGQYSFSNHYRKFTNAVLFNVNTGEIFDMTDYGLGSDWGQSRNKSGSFVNGKALITSSAPIYSSIRDIYLIDIDFRLSTIVEDYHFDEYGSYSKNGYFYCDTGDVLEEKHGYYNENFEMVIDLSNYEVHSASAFVNGCAVVEIENSEGTKFVIVIDEEGNYLFDPIEVISADYDYSEGLLAVDLGDDNITYIDKNGEVSFTIPRDGTIYYDTVRCSDGIVTNGSAYYDKTGKQLFN